MAAPLTAEWFAAARSATADVRIDPARTGRVQFVAGATTWHLVVAGGRIERWDLGAIDDAEVEIRLSEADARRIVTRELRGTDALRAVTVSDGTYTGPAAPANLLARPELDAVPAVAGATFSVQLRYRNGPFGAVDHVMAFTDGRLSDERLDTTADPDVTVEVLYRAMAQVRAGEITIVETLEDGSITGEIGPMAALAGILESPEFHAAELASGRHAFPLSVLGELDAEPGFAAAMDALVDPPAS